MFIDYPLPPTAHKVETRATNSSESHPRRHAPCFPPAPTAPRTSPGRRSLTAGDQLPGGPVELSTAVTCISAGTVTAAAATDVDDADPVMSRL
eukprot:597151-Rhodomonas_salina.1